MNQKEKKEVTHSKSKAFGFSFLVCMAEAIVFAIVYAIGYFAYIVPIAGVLFAMIIFQKFSKNTWQNILINFAWCLLWTLGFNLVSVLVVNALSLYELGYSFFTAFPVMITLIQTDLEIRQFIVEMIVKSSLITIGCAIVGLIYFMSSYFAQKKKGDADSSNAENSNAKTMDIVYFNLFSSTKHSYERFKEDNNKELLKADIEKLSTTYLVKLSDEDKKSMLDRVQSELLKENLEDADKKTLEILQKMLK